LYKKAKLQILIRIMGYVCALKYLEHITNI
jgi:hypothetical protein